MALKIQINIYKYNTEDEYVKIESISESWTEDMSIEDLKELIEESTCNLKEDQKVFFAGVHLPDDAKLSPDWDMQDTIVLDVIIDNKVLREASVVSKLDHTVWLVTGKGTDFSWYPLPQNHTKPIRLNSKGLIPWIPKITKDVHFLICIQDGKDDGRWEGKSYTVKGHGNDFILKLEQGDDKEIMVFVEYTKQHEGVSTLSACHTQEIEELNPSEESKVYYQSLMNDRERLIHHIAAGATVLSVPVGIAALCCIM